jgi:hypothetical protein
VSCGCGIAFHRKLFCFVIVEYLDGRIFNGVFCYYFKQRAGIPTGAGQGSGSNPSASDPAGSSPTSRGVPVAVNTALAIAMAMIMIIEDQGLPGIELYSLTENNMHLSNPPLVHLPPGISIKLNLS